jgi:hypothetical protein
MTDGPTQRLDAALAGRYRIERKLGEGGMASVYLAEDVKHERKVAVKILRPELAAVLGGERFLAEIKTTANLQHPHILPLFDSGEADGFLYYVMPYIEGESLRERLDREQQLGVEEAVRIAREVADALDYAHRSDVIHRDIKPANILLHDGQNPGFWPTGLAWGDDGFIYASPRGPGATIARLPEDGGAPDTVVHHPDGFELRPRDVLPGGDGVLTTVAGESSGSDARTIIVDVETGDTTSVGQGAVDARWSETGHVVYASRSGGFFAVPFDVDAHRPTGRYRWRSGGRVERVDGARASPRGQGLGPSSGNGRVPGPSDRRLVGAERGPESVHYAGDQLVRRAPERARRGELT